MPIRGQRRALGRTGYRQVFRVGSSGIHRRFSVSKPSDLLCFSAISKAFAFGSFIRGDPGSRIPEWTRCQRLFFYDMERYDTFSAGGRFHSRR